MKFWQLYSQRVVSKEEIDDYIDEWHSSDSEEPLHEFLGMPEFIFEQFLKDPDFFWACNEE